MISVLIRNWRFCKSCMKTVKFSLLSSLSAVFTSRCKSQNKIKRKDICEKTRKKSLCQKHKDRYQNASLTVEAAVAFPVFFFAVMYLLQMFSILRAEVMIAEAAISSVREAAAYSYVAERMAEGDVAVADTLFEFFDRKIIRDVTMTGVFYGRCDAEILKEGSVAQGLGGMWVNTEDAGDKTRIEIRYRVTPGNSLTSKKENYYTRRLVYRNWTGEGGSAGKTEGPEEDTKSATVYVTEHGTVYHTEKSCSHIKIETIPVEGGAVDKERNSSGGKYSACDFCAPESGLGKYVYVTKHGTKYHAVSSCSAIRRDVKECSMEEAKEKYRPCSRCAQEQ